MTSATANESAYLSEIFVSWQGEGSRAGQRHLFVRFAGCNIRCRWCDTPDSLTRVPVCTVDYPDGEQARLDNPVALADLARVLARCCEQDPTIAMIAITGGEPMVQSAFLARWLSQSPPPVPCLLETNAILTHGLAEVLSGIALVSADVKLPSNTGEPEFWERHRAFLEGCRGTELYVKMPVDAATEAADVERAARLVAECAPQATLFVQPITAFDGPAWQIDSPGLGRLATIAATVVHDTRVLPQLHKLAGIR